MEPTEWTPTVEGMAVLCPEGNCQLCQDPSCFSPILIDTTGTGFQLTSASDGVWFDFYGTGSKVQLSWTAAGASNGWLVLDRNGNGAIDSAKEMFGNVTHQPPSSTPNGFLALAEFDKPENGGNSDSVIDSGDAIFSSLRVWIDANHNGVSESNELLPLAALAIASIELEYREAARTDQFGNQLRYRAKIYDVGRGHMGRWAYDVFLLAGNPTAGSTEFRLFNGLEPWLVARRSCNNPLTRSRRVW